MMPRANCLNPDILTESSKPRLTRRGWLKRTACTAGTLAGAVGLYTWQIEPYWVEVVERVLAIQGVPESLVGKTLVQISDIHIGDNVDDSFLITWFQRVAEWKPDIVVFTGDFLTLNRDRTLPTEKMKKVLYHFPQGNLATIGICGNHDYGYRWSDSDAARQVMRIATDSGLTMLRNESYDVSGLQFVGFDDYWSPNFCGPELLERTDLDRPTLVLCHNPDVAVLPIWRGYRGWILSGHTHGGQCKAPFFTPPQLPIVNKRLFAGAFHLPEGHQLYVNRALGHSLQVRFNARPEITVFRIQSQKSELARI